jgi:superfamily I DNA and RNA helicase
MSLAETCILLAEEGGLDPDHAQTMSQSRSQVEQRSFAIKDIVLFRATCKKLLNKGNMRIRLECLLESKSKHYLQLTRLRAETASHR